MSEPSTGRQLDRARGLARIMDRAVRIPGTRFRIGLDPILGLAPGFGDVAGAAIAAYPLWVGARLGAPAEVLLRMLGNVSVDTILGAIPLLGDLFDFGWRANSRNVGLLEEWVEAPSRVRRTSRVALGVVLAGAVLLIGLLAWGVLVAGAWVLGRFS